MKVETNFPTRSSYLQPNNRWFSRIFLGRSFSSTGFNSGGRRAAMVNADRLGLKGASDRVDGGPDGCCCCLPTVDAACVPDQFTIGRAVRYEQRHAVSEATVQHQGQSDDNGADEGKIRCRASFATLGPMPTIHCYGCSGSWVRVFFAIHEIRPKGRRFCSIYRPFPRSETAAIRRPRHPVRGRRTRSPPSRPCRLRPRRRL